MKKRIVNRHHIIYPSADHPEQELVVNVWNGEHEIATKMQLYTRKSVSKGFIKWLDFYLAINRDRAKEL